VPAEEVCCAELQNVPVLRPVYEQQEQAGQQIQLGTAVFLVGAWWSWCWRAVTLELLFLQLELAMTVDKADA